MSRPVIAGDVERVTIIVRRPFAGSPPVGTSATVRYTPLIAAAIGHGLLEVTAVFGPQVPDSPGPDSPLPPVRESKPAARRTSRKGS